MTETNSLAAHLLGRSLDEVATNLRAGAVTSAQLTVAALQVAEQSQPRCNAFLRLRRDAAIEAAHALDREAAAGRWRGLLHGIPLAHKDCFERAREPMTVGSAVRQIPEGRRTATVLQRLAQAGAVDLGALNLSEMVAGPTGQNPHFGDCLNARDPQRISGGSSSGSATAVAAKLIPAALGSDTGGSIRLPASVQGLFGLKPTYGRVSRQGCFPRAFSLDCVGPLARSARDCAIVLQAIAGQDSGDSTSLPADTPDYVGLLERQAAGSSIAVLDTGVTLAPAVQSAFDRFLEAAGDRYGKPPVVSYPGWSQCYSLSDICSKVEAAAFHGPWMRTEPGSYSRAVYSRTEPGLHIPAVRYLEALSIRAAILRDFIDGPFATADVLVLPTIPVEVPRRDEADMEAKGRVFDVVARLTTLTRPFSYLGLPVLSMPIGLDAAGMPVGAQLVGRPLAEGRLLAMADALSRDLCTSRAGR